MSEPRILVCDHCYKRSCWEWIFPCDDARTAGLVMATKDQLDRLSVERPSYYEPLFLDGGEHNTLEPLLEKVEAALARLEQ